MTRPPPGPRGPVAVRASRSRRAVAAVVVAACLAATACGRDAPPASPAPAAVPAAPHPAEGAAAAVLAAVDTADVARFAALSADRKDPAAPPARADDVRATLEDLHQRYGLRARTVAAATVVSATEADVEVALDGGAAVVVLTLRRAADGVWRLVGLSESAAPTMPGDGPPATGPAPAK
ncbi:MAG: hypothetical protein U1E39_13045 [Planctomycetota bacterium]